MTLIFRKQDKVFIHAEKSCVYTHLFVDKGEIRTVRFINNRYG